MFQSYKKNSEVTFDHAEIYQQWLDEAQAYDKKNGLDQWKKIDQTEAYDFILVRTRLDKLRRMRVERNIEGVLFALNEGIHGNLGGMGNEALYARAKSGTKQLVEDYIVEISEALEYLASPEVDDISFEAKLEFFTRAQECFGQSALMLSGSGSLLYFHIGVVLALAEQNLIPKVISGSSGGAFIGSMLCSHTNDELERVFDVDHFADDKVLQDKEEATKAKKAEKKGVFSALVQSKVSASDFESGLARLVPDMTFEEAYEKTGRHLNISVSSANSPKNSLLLSAKTSPHVFLRESIRASASAPGLFPPSMLFARNDAGERQAYLPTELWVDGSLSSDLPTKRLARLYGAKHFIVSQTNPHVIPFVTDAKRKRDPMSLLKYASFDTARTWINTGAALWRKPMAANEKINKVTHTLLSIINQNYKGDINIMPPKQYFNPAKQFGWMTKTDMIDLIEAGKRATWPKMEMIRLQSKISRSLESIIAGLHREVVQQSRRGRVDAKKTRSNSRASSASKSKPASKSKRASKSK